MRFVVGDVDTLKASTLGSLDHIGRVDYAIL
jgi:hypothetical protein